MLNRPQKEVTMRWCAYCNRSLGSQEEGVIVETAVVHSLCEQSYRKELSDRIARIARHRFLRLPSIHASDESECA